MTIKMKNNDGDRIKIGLWKNAKRKLSKKTKKKNKITIIESGNEMSVIQDDEEKDTKKKTN